MPAIPPSVRQAALHFPSSSADADKPEGVEALPVEGGLVAVTQTVCIVDVPDLAPGRAQRALDQVREVLRARDRTWAYWSLDSEQALLVRTLKQLGLVENHRPPWEARFTAMALVSEPEGGSGETGEVTAH